MDTLRPWTKWSEWRLRDRAYEMYSPLTVWIRQMLTGPFSQHTFWMVTAGKNTGGTNNTCQVSQRVMTVRQHAQSKDPWRILYSCLALWTMLHDDCAFTLPQSWLIYSRTKINVSQIYESEQYFYFFCLKYVFQLLLHIWFAFSKIWKKKMSFLTRSLKMEHFCIL